LYLSENKHRLVPLTA